MSDNSAQVDNEFSVIQKDGHLVVQHRKLREDDPKAKRWSAGSIGPNHILLTDSAVSLEPASGFSFFSAADFKNILIGMSRSKWSGVVKVDANGFLKKIFFDQGQLCFASSTLIDDRLGERLYRTGRITLDQMVDSASQVDRNRKFGQVLIQSGVMNAVELWEALKDQVLEIFRSVFIADQVQVSFDRGEHMAFMQVVYPESTESMIVDCFSFACMLRSFKGQITSDTQVKVLVDPAGHPDLQPGTFVGDMVDLMTNTLNVNELIKQSKLKSHNTLSVLLQLRNEGVCKLVDNQSENLSLKSISSKLSNEIDLYSLTLRHAVKVFKEHEAKLPIEQLRQFALGRNKDGNAAFFLNERGELDADCRQNLYAQCLEGVERVDYFHSLVQALIHFLLQLSIDLAPREATKEIMSKYREMI